MARPVEMDAKQIEIAALKADREYLWKALAQIEGWSAVAPADQTRRVHEMIKKALDDFRPHVEVRS